MTATMQSIIKNLADTDFYKLTMLQFIWAMFPKTRVTFKFNNRTNMRLLDAFSVQEAQDAFGAVTRLRFPEQHLEALRTQYGYFFHDDFLCWLGDLQLEMPDVIREDADGQLSIEATGYWPKVTLWEIPGICIPLRLFNLSRMKNQGLREDDVLETGMQRAIPKLDRLSATGATFIDYSTRRRFSYEHQCALLLRAQQYPGLLIGTSNVDLGLTHNIPLKGTMAHELTMGLQGVLWEEDEASDRLVSQKRLWEMWETFYYGQLTVALTDTYGNAFGLEDFESFAPRWSGSRHDSGDPFKYGEAVLAQYLRLNIDPKDKLIVFSDGLTHDRIVALTQHFASRIQPYVGWGTHFGNDMGHGLNPLSLVMKLVRVWHDDRWIHTVKVPDNLAKATGSQDMIDRILRKTGSRLQDRQNIPCEV